MTLLRSFIPVIALVLATVPVAGHELWIEPVVPWVEPEGRIEAHLVNGELFGGTRLSYLPGRIERFELHLGDSAVPVDGRIGDVPALSMPALGAGLHVALYQSGPATLRYDSYDKLGAFAAHKDLGDIAAMNAARGLPAAPVTETYRRFSKALIAVGDGAGEDRRFGLETEFVALDRPAAGAPMRLQLFGPDGPRADVQAELFDRAPDGTVAVTLLRTDAAGIVTLRPEAGHDYMADSVILRIPDAAVAAETGADWETLWANIVFRLPP